MIRRLILTALLTLTVAGCGVTVEPHPRGVEPPPGPFAGLASAQPSAPATAASGSVDQTLYFVRDGRLVAVTRHVDNPATVDEAVAALQAGPTETERASGLATALAGTDVVTGITVAGDQASIALTAPVEGGSRADETLAYAQLVCTLTARTDIRSVVFTSNGQPIGVPRGDGALSTEPLTAADYSTLVGE
ncbi:GerMN domain-containing protein [Hamadaea sp. NPDC050747]|uniref:GerMN domain-containing protein n=1 Tax=Hamadaea sp. NPDC050747 TaxID=3155789 RepID=UPI0034097C9C